MEPTTKQSTKVNVKETEESVDKTEFAAASTQVKEILLPDAMRRVDWRWAVAKGFLNKETNEWNEQHGGQEAYLKQRNERMIARQQELALRFNPSLVSIIINLFPILHISF